MSDHFNYRLVHKRKVLKHVCHGSITRTANNTPMAVMYHIFTSIVFLFACSFESSCPKSLKQTYIYSLYNFSVILLK